MKVTNQDGPQIKIVGYRDRNGNLTAISAVSATTKAGPDPAIIATSGVTVGQVTTGTPWDIALAPSPIDGSQNVPVDSTLALTLNGTTAVNVNLSQGESLSQVTNDIFAALTAAGVDAVNIGNDVTFLHDAAGNEITDVSQSLSPASQGTPLPNAWFEVTLNVAQRIIQS